MYLKMRRAYPRSINNVGELLDVPYIYIDTCDEFSPTVWPNAKINQILFFFEEYVHAVSFPRDLEGLIRTS